MSTTDERGGAHDGWASPGPGAGSGPDEWSDPWRMHAHGAGQQGSDGPPPPAGPPYGPPHGPPHGPPPGWRPEDRHESVDTLAIIALILAIIPITFLIGLVLGIVGLVRCSRPRRRSGWGQSLAATIVGSIWLVIFSWATIGMIAVGSGGSVERSATGEVVEARVVSVFELREGDCYNMGDDATYSDEAEEYEEVEIVPCAVDHRHQVIEISEIDAATFPGGESIAGDAERICQAAVDRLEVPAWPGGGYSLNYMFPSEQSWRLADDREILCIATSYAMRDDTFL